MRKGNREKNITIIMGKMRVTNEKNCYCHTCKKWYHYLGITMHRLGHKNRKQDCTITFTHGNTKRWSYSKRK